MWPGAGWTEGQAQFELGLEGSDGHGLMDTREEGVPGEGGEYESRCEVGLCRHADDRGMGEALSRDPVFPSSRDRQGPLLADCVHCSLSCATPCRFQRQAGSAPYKIRRSCRKRVQHGAGGAPAFSFRSSVGICYVLVTEASGPDTGLARLVFQYSAPSWLGRGFPPEASPHIYSPIHWAQSLCRM